MNWSELMNGQISWPVAEPVEHYTGVDENDLDGWVRKH
jgi:hypothetical protein